MDVCVPLDPDLVTERALSGIPPRPDHPKSDIYLGLPSVIPFLQFIWEMTPGRERGREAASVSSNSSAGASSSSYRRA